MNSFHLPWNARLLAIQLETSMRIAILSLLVVSAFALPAFARGTKTHTAGGQVVHSRRAGVIMHKAVPPFAGVHVYEKQPASRRTGRSR
jgi:hypothetical protein